MRFFYKFLCLLLVCALSGCTGYGYIPLTEEWYHSDAKFTTVAVRAADISTLSTTDGSKIPDTLRVYERPFGFRYSKALVGDYISYYSEPGNMTGFVMRGGPGKENIDKRIKELADFLQWSRLEKTERIATQGIKITRKGDEYIYLERPEGPVLMFRKAGSYAQCMFSYSCYAVQITPRAASIMMIEFSAVKREKFN